MVGMGRHMDSPVFNASDRADMHVGDLVRLTNPVFADLLEQYLQNNQAPFGPFAYVSDAAIKLQQLRRAGKEKVAGQLQRHLEGFAQDQGFSAAAFDQWWWVIRAKDRRDAMGPRPFKPRSTNHSIISDEDITFLKGLISDPTSPIAAYKDAVSALIKVAQASGLE